MSLISGFYPHTLQLSYLPLILNFLNLEVKESYVIMLWLKGSPYPTINFKASIDSNNPIIPGTIPITPASAQLY